jgi:hypothetical protein
MFERAEEAIQVSPPITRGVQDLAAIEASRLATLARFNSLLLPIED